MTDKRHETIKKGKNIRTKGYLYNYQTKLLLERISWFARDNGDEKTIITFEHRRGTDYENMKRYLLRLKEEQTNISWDNIDINKMKVLKKVYEPLLQVSDNMCGAIKDGFEYNEYEDIESRYALLINELLYRYEGKKLYSYGLKFTHCEKMNDYIELESEYGWLKQISDLNEALPS